MTHKLDLVVHPDGRRVAFTLTRDGWDVWALENFLLEH